METASPAQGLPGPLQISKKITGWYIGTAVLFIVLGIFAIIEPGVAGLGLTLLVGWLLIISGVAHLIGVFKGGGAKQVVYQILIGLLYAIGGFYCLTHPFLAISALTLMLAAVVLAGGILEIISYFQLKGETASGWLLFNGILSLLLGGMIWFHWPSSSVWAIGTLVGVKLLMTGVTRLMFGLATRRFAVSKY
jgi:uncharacterized membrane protein HdeD (DUF308 family)